MTKFNLLAIAALLFFFLGYSSYYYSSSSYTLANLKSLEQENPSQKEKTSSWKKTNSSSIKDSKLTLFKEESSEEKIPHSTENKKTKSNASYQMKVSTDIASEDSAEIRRLKNQLENESVSINFADGNFPDAFNELGVMIDVAFIIDKNVLEEEVENLTIELENVQAKIVFSFLLKMTGLVYRYEKDGIHIAKPREKDFQYLDNYKTADEALDALFPRLKFENEQAREQLEYSFPTSFLSSYLTLTDSQKLGLNYLRNQQRAEGQQLQTEENRTSGILMELMQELRRTYLAKYINLLDKDQQNQLARLVTEELLSKWK